VDHSFHDELLCRGVFDKARAALDQVWAQPAAAPEARIVEGSPSQAAEAVVMDQDTAPDLSHAQFLRIALDALTARAARWLTLVLAFVLFGYCMLEPTWLRLATAAGFTVLIHVPLWWRRDK